MSSGGYAHTLHTTLPPRSLRIQLSYLHDLVTRAKFREGATLLRRNLRGRVHLVLDTELYSMNDLHEVQSGDLSPVLAETLDMLLPLVSQRG